jgi:hypothetical protein
MKALFTIIAIVLIASSCSNVLDKPLDKEHFDQVKESINGNQDNSPMKKKYIIDNLKMYLGFAEMGKSMDMDEALIQTYRDYIEDLSKDFDSTRLAKLEAHNNNVKLEIFVSSVKSAFAESYDEHRGVLSMRLKFNNQFEKEVLYMIFSYKYIDKYDTEFFDEKGKMTYRQAWYFEDEGTIILLEEYNDVADFIFSKVPVQSDTSITVLMREEEANKTLAELLEEEKANPKVEEYDFLKEGLKVSALAVVFKDKSEVVFQDADWEYLDNE